MTEPAITGIVFGVILFVLGMIPGLFGAVKKEFQNFQVVFPKRSWIDNIKQILWASGDIWLLVGGGLSIIVGLLVLLASKEPSPIALTQVFAWFRRFLR